MYCVFLVKDNGEQHLMDFYKSESSARRYMESLKHLKLNGKLVLDYAGMDSIRAYINKSFVGGKENA